MAVTMTDVQLERLLRAVQGGGGVAAGTATVVGPKGPCNLGKERLEEGRGATKETWVYVVAGERPEPLLGDHNAEDLGVISYHPRGRDPHHDGQAQEGGQEGDH